MWSPPVSTAAGFNCCAGSVEVGGGGTLCCAEGTGVLFVDAGLATPTPHADKSCPVVDDKTADSLRSIVAVGAVVTVTGARSVDDGNREKGAGEEVGRVGGREEAS